MSEGVAALPCICCGKVLENVWDDAVNQPREAVAFVSPGNYGSEVFDPVLTGNRIEINICDHCLTTAGAAGRVYTYTNVVPVVTDNEGLMLGWLPVMAEYQKWNSEIELPYVTVDYSDVQDRDDVQWTSPPEVVEELLQHDAGIE